MFKRKIVGMGPGWKYHTVTLPPQVVSALGIKAGSEVDLDLVATDDGETVLIVSKGD